MMTRNTEKRVEVAAPILDQDIRRQINHYLKVMLSDNVKAREEDHNGNYKIPKNQDTPLNSQEFFHIKQGIFECEKCKFINSFVPFEIMTFIISKFH